MRKFTILILLFCLGFAACKKKKNEEPVVATTGPTGPSTFPYSVMQTAYYYVQNGSSVTVDSNFMAFFFEKPIGSSPNSNISAGTVQLNDTNLYYYSGSYVKLNEVNISQSLKWTASGSGTINAFTYSFTPSYPKYTGAGLLPDTCIKANGITINIGGLSNLQNFVSVSISQSPNSMFKTLSGNGTVTFSASEISNFVVNQPVHLELVFQNSNNVLLSGVLHSFNNNLWFNKTMYLK